VTATMLISQIISQH